MRSPNTSILREIPIHEHFFVEARLPRCGRQCGASINGRGDLKKSLWEPWPWRGQLCRFSNKRPRNGRGSPVAFAWNGWKERGRKKVWRRRLAPHRIEKGEIIASALDRKYWKLWRKVAVKGPLMDKQTRKTPKIIFLAPRGGSQEPISEGRSENQTEKIFWETHKVLFFARPRFQREKSSPESRPGFARNWKRKKVRDGMRGCRFVGFGLSGEGTAGPARRKIKKKKKKWR